MATIGAHDLERTALLVSRLKRASSIIHSQRPFHSTKPITLMKGAVSPTHLQFRPLSMAAIETTTTGEDSSLQQLNYLRRLAQDNPFIMEKGAPPEASEFEFPLGSLFKAPNRQVGLACTEMYADALREYGIYGIEMEWPDPESQFILEVINKMGCRPDSHSSTQGAL